MSTVKTIDITEEQLENAVRDAVKRVGASRYFTIQCRVELRAAETDAVPG